MTAWQEAQFITHDGLSLFYRYRSPNNIASKDTLLFLHRGHEHSQRMIPIADTLSEGEYWCFAFDLRGHGLSQGKRAWAPSFHTWVKDLNSFVGHLQQQFQLSPSDMLVVSNSVSSVMVLSWVLHYGAAIKGCILAAPAFSIKLYIPLALPALKLLARFTSQQFVTSYVRSTLLTRNQQAALDYDNDKLITKKIGVNVLVTLFTTAKYCFTRLEDFETPVLLITASNDYIVDNSFHHTFFKRISSEDKQHLVLDDFKHAVFFENERHKITQPAKAFIQRLFNHPPKQLPILMTPERVHTVTEYNQLLDKGSTLKQLYYAIYRWCMVNLGQCSDGVAIGIKYGFDSGVALDYVYKNIASGSHFLGEWVDRIYLNAVGWRGIRMRKANIKTILHTLATRQHEQQQSPIIVDVASGVGRYLFEIQREADYAIDLHLNDIDPHSLAAAKALALDFSTERVTFSEEDIFNSDFLQYHGQQPTIIVVSGVLELYQSNAQVTRVLAQLYTLLQAGGYLVYTGQPWHPQMELIGRLLNNRQGQRWVMRRRMQTEMDQLVTAAGFTKLDTAADDLGNFTVSCAQKPLD